MKPTASHRTFILGLFILLVVSARGQRVTSTTTDQVTVGLARIDITPEGPIRLTGYAARAKKESEGVIHRLYAKAMAMGTDAEGPSILITVDLVGIPGHMTSQLAAALAKKTSIDPARLAICASHTHGGPEVGTLLNILQARGDSFSDSLLSLEQLVHISQYIQQLQRKLEEVALAALADRKPAQLSWGQSQAGFAKNRRTEDGPVDTALPLLRVTAPDGTLRAVFLSYACHGTTLSGEVNKIHGDWIAEAQGIIERRHPGTLAMIALGCAGDANPNPRGQMQDVTAHATEIAASVDKLLTAQLHPLTSPPRGQMTWINLPFAHIPSVDELVKQSEDQSVKGYYARLALQRIARGHGIPPSVHYPIQTWTFGNDLAMINLGGEVVVDYAIRLKNELGAENLWVNAYANDVPCYIASRRVLREGGYEAESSMYWYDKPSPLSEEAEDMIVSAVHDLLPESYRYARPENNVPKVVEVNGSTLLKAEEARAIGPEIKYMPEWKAFGWFTEADKVEWDVHVTENGKYDVYLDWAVSDQEALKPFVLEASTRSV
jgi:hypothetical protein